jgi:hypothetical protein
MIFHIVLSYFGGSFNLEMGYGSSCIVLQNIQVIAGRIIH